MDSIESFSINSSRKFCSTERTSSHKSFNVTGNRKLLPSTREHNYCISSSETTGTLGTDAYSFKMRVNSSTGGLCSGTSRGSNSGILATDSGSSKQFGLGKRSNFTEDAKLELEDGEDPFAFDEDEFEPSKWDLLSGKQKTSRTRKSGGSYRELEDGRQARILISQQELSNGDNNHPHELSCPSAVDEVGSSLLADCLLTAVKVFHLIL